MLLAAAVPLGWLPFLWRPMSQDEGGFLIVASQWREGSSLYGDYWVDRPPVLIWLFSIPDGLGDPWALRLLGTIAAVVVVLLAARIGSLAAPDARFGAVLPAATAAIFVATPLFGGSVVDSELLALPFVLGGVAAALAALTSAAENQGPRVILGLAMLAGSAGVLAAMTKQSEIDVFVALVVLVALTRNRILLVGAVLGAALTLAVILQLSAARGTDAGELWNALVTFRGEAAKVIAESASSATPARFVRLLGAFVGTAAPLVIVALALRLRTPKAHGPVDLRWVAIALLSWEFFVVLAGGSYWLHYLMGLIPGLVVLAAAATQRPILVERTLVLPYAAAALSTVISIAVVVLAPLDRPEVPVIDYLKAEAGPDDTVVVAFGSPNIPRSAGLDAPYEYLWSLPVRVRDNELVEFTEVLSGEDPPTWVVTTGRPLATWGVDVTRAETVLRDRYVLMATADRYTIFKLADQ